MKGNQAAVKLELFAHTPGQTPTKGGQQNSQEQSKMQSGASVMRKSQGQGQATALETDHTGEKSTGEVIPDTPESPPKAGALTEGEPSLKEVL